MGCRTGTQWKAPLHAGLRLRPSAGSSLRRSGGILAEVRWRNAADVSDDPRQVAQPSAPLPRRYGKRRASFGSLFIENINWSALGLMTRNPEIIYLAV